MKIEIHISEEEINDVLEALKEQGVDVSRIDVEQTIEDYIYGAFEDSKDERMDAIVDILLDQQD